MPDFLQRILQRKLVQWCLAYLAGAWALLQGVDFIADEFGWSAAVSRITLVVLGVGLLVVAVLAWYHGHQGRQRITVTETVILASLLVLAAAAAVLVGRRSGHAQKAAAAVADELSPIEPQSIAVLPFANRSDDQANEYFSDGIAEEILNTIAKLPGLRVASRTSSFSFKEQNLSIAQIAQKLRVTHVLEGSVRKFEQQVRISAQLIDTRSDRLLWSEEFSRDLNDVFAVQQEIAAAIARALEIQLSGNLVGVKRTNNSRAHDHYLLGLSYWHRRTYGGLEQSIAQFESAIRQDSLYADAWNGLALAHTIQPIYGLRVNTTESSRLALRAAKRALELDSTLAQPHAAIGWVLCQYEWKRKPCEAELRRAVQMGPNDAVARGWLGIVLAQLGRTDEALAETSRAVRLDPLSVFAHQLRAMVLYRQGRIEESMAEFRLSRSIEPGAQTAHFFLTRLYVKTGQYDSAKVSLRKVAELRTYPQLEETAQFIDALRTRQLDQARRVLNAWEKSPVFAAYQLAVYHALAGDREEAVRLLHRSLAQREYALSNLSLDPEWLALRPDPRIDAILRRLGLPLQR